MTLAPQRNSGKVEVKNKSFSAKVIFVQTFIYQYSERGLPVKMWEWIVSQGKPDVPVSKSSGWLGIANLRRHVIALGKETFADHICSGNL